MLGTIKNRIEKLVFTQCNGSKRQLAESLGVEINTVDLWDEDHIPKGDTLQRLHELYNIDLHWLLTGKGDFYAPYPDGDPNLQRAIGLDRSMETICRTAAPGNQTMSQALYLMEEGEDLLLDRITRLERDRDDLRNKIEEIYDCFKTKRNKEMSSGMSNCFGTLYIELVPPPSYNLLFVNNPFSEALDEPLSRILGKPFLSFIEPSYREKFKRHIDNVIDCRLPSFFRIKICSGDKEPVSCRAIHIPVLDNAGSITKIVGYGHITFSK